MLMHLLLHPASELSGFVRPLPLYLYLDGYLAFCLLVFPPLAIFQESDLSFSWFRLKRTARMRVSLRLFANLRDFGDYIITKRVSSMALNKNLLIYIER